MIGLASKILIMFLVGFAWLVTIAFADSGFEFVMLTFVWGIIAALIWINT